MIKISKDSKLFIWGSSEEVRTGGAEVLNMLAAKLKSLGVDAQMFNWNRDVYIQGDYYKSLYDVNCGRWRDIKNEEKYIILLPECMVEDLDNIRCYYGYDKVQFIIWWLSTGFDYKDHEKKTSKRLQMTMLSGMKNHTLHLCESELAMRDLLYYGIEERMIFQHGTNSAYYDNPIINKKKDAIFYNGLKLSTRNFVETYLIPRMPDIEFKTVNYDRAEFLSKDDMCNLYDECKVYIDYSGFEGRELMPREACLRNCVLYLVNQGNAATFDDYPIPNEYKFNIYENCDKGSIDELVNRIRKSIKNYDKEIHNFDFFKNKCQWEPLKFEWEIRNIFGPMIPDKNKNLII